ncbi:hypothetical protein Tco_1052063 [Tanacetum coccineum]
MRLKLANILGELVRELPLEHYPSFCAKCRRAEFGDVGTRLGTPLDLRTHMESDRWPKIYAGIQQLPSTRENYIVKKGCSQKKDIGLPEEDGI